MDLSLSEAAKIISKSEDEVMYYHQTNKIQARVDQDSLAWKFDLKEILELKAQLEAAEEALSEEKVDQDDS